MKLTCENEKASNHPYTWEYTGSKGSGEWVNCPKCMNKVKIPEKGED